MGIMKVKAQPQYQIPLLEVTPWKRSVPLLTERPLSDPGVRNVLGAEGGRVG